METDRCLACGEDRPIEELLFDEECETCREQRFVFVHIFRGGVAHPSAPLPATRVSRVDCDGSHSGELCDCWRIREVLAAEAEEAGFL